MRSFFIGFALFLAFVPLAPLTACWVVGERFQGRVGVAFVDPVEELPSFAGTVLAVCTLLFSIIWPCAIGALLR